MTPPTKAPLILTTAIAAILALAGASAPQAAMSQSTASPSQFGEVSLKNYDSLQVTVKGPVIVDAHGVGLKMTSKRYDMAAPHIHLEIKNKVVSTGVATGGVHIEVRNPEQQSTTQVTCDTARYTRQAEGTGRIDMVGHVQTKTYSPQLDKPLINNSQSGYVLFGGSEGTIAHLDHGDLTVTPIEPSTAPSRK